MYLVVFITTNNLDKRGSVMTTNNDSLISQDILKYSYLILPFKFTESIDEHKILSSDYFELCDHSKIKYNRLYKHISDSISEKNKDRTIHDFWFNRNKHFTSFFRTELHFSLINELQQNIMIRGYMKDIFIYCFDNGIGFFVIHFVFDNDTNIDDICEVLNKLKKINREMKDAQLSIASLTKELNLMELITNIMSKLYIDSDLFFQYSNKKYVSATLINSFCYTSPQEEAKIIEDIECLKRSQPRSYGTYYSKKDTFIRPFKNMYWAFSTQGVANINYFDPEIGNTSFVKTFYKNVKREYLLMSLIILNQEYMLLDYCQKFVQSIDEIPSNEELNRLYKFQIHNTYSIVSYLEHYRSFYEAYYNELGIDQVLKEVNAKQQAIYQANKNKASEKKAKKEASVNKFTKILSVTLSIFGISGLINNIANLISRENALELTLIVVPSVALVVAVTILLSNVFSKASENKHRRKSKNERR